eukprot:4404876-Amphidinium_carterae.1
MAPICKAAKGNSQYYGRAFNTPLACFKRIQTLSCATALEASEPVMSYFYNLHIQSKEKVLYYR